MEKTGKTYIVYPIRDDRKPFIFNPKNTHIDWVAFGEFMKGIRPVRNISSNKRSSKQRNYNQERAWL